MASDLVTSRRSFLRMMGLGAGATLALMRPHRRWHRPHQLRAAGTDSGASLDWQAYKGSTVRMILNKHPFTESLLPLIPQFEQLTGISTTNLILPEDEFFQKLLVVLSTGAGSYDVFMTDPRSLGLRQGRLDAAAGGLPPGSEDDGRGL